jgi:hypothetical protein
MAKTLGAVIIDEKKQRFKIGHKWHDFQELMTYKDRMDNEYQRSSSTLRLFGARGSSSTGKKVTKSYDIIVTLDSLDEPIITIPIIKKPLGGRAFDNAMKMADETKAAFDYILRHRE